MGRYLGCAEQRFFCSVQVHRTAVHHFLANNTGIGPWQRNQTPRTYFLVTAETNSKAAPIDPIQGSGDLAQPEGFAIERSYREIAQLGFLNPI